MTLFDRWPSAPCPVCERVIVLRKDPDERQLIWEHWADGYDPGGGLCPGGGRLVEGEETQ